MSRTKPEKMRTLLTHLLTLFVVAASLISVAAQQGLPDKPFNQWTKAEAKEILNDSPWAKTQVALAVYGLGVPTDFKFTLRLRSALPIREALVRLKQIEAHYDQMGEEARMSFDGKMKGLLDCPACVDNYVLSLSSRSENSPGCR